MDDHPIRPGRRAAQSIVPLNRHQAFIASRIPAPLKHPGSACLKALARLEPSLPPWYAQAAVALRTDFEKSQHDRCVSQHELEAILARILPLERFAEPLLKEAIHKTFGLELDVRQTYFVRRMQRRRASSLGGLLDFSAGDPQVRHWYWDITLLEAALHNFVAAEAAKAPAEGSEFITHDHNSGGVRMTYIREHELPLRPERFAALCRMLDLGGRYQAHLNAVLNPVDVGQKQRLRQTWVLHLRNELREAVHLARMKDDIPQDAYRMLLQWLADLGDMRLDGHGVRPLRLRMLGVDLSDILLFGAGHGGTLQRCVAYVPGDDRQPIRHYASTTAFMIELRTRLHGAGYRRFFSRFIPIREQAAFFSALKKRLDPADRHDMWDDYRLDPGLRVGLELVERPLRVDSRAALERVLADACELKIGRMLGDARSLAVPTNDEDREARIARFMAMFDAGMDVLNLLVFVPGLGQVMLLAMATRMLHEVYSGVEAWEAGETREAWAHLLGVAMNVVFIGGVGAVLPHVDTSAFVDSLVPVSLREGVMRLWKPDLRPYEHQPLLPSGALPDKLGAHDYLDDYYLPLEGRYYRLQADEHWPGGYRARHARADELVNPYAPVFRSNGAGGWRHELDAPLSWDDERLFARLGPEAASLDGLSARRIMDLCGIDADVLREVQQNVRLPPALLGDTVTRFVLDRELGRLVQRLQAGGASSGSLDELHMEMQLLTSDRVWPRSKVLRLLNGSGRLLQEYPENIDAGIPRIEVRWPGLDADGLLEQVLRQLDEAQIRTLLREEFGLGTVSLSARVATLRQRLAGEAVRRRADLFDSHYYHRTAPVRDEPGVAVLHREFPRLPVRVAQELARQADSRELQQFDAGRVPLRLAEEARHYLRTVHQVRLYESLYLDSVNQDEAYRVVLPMLEQLPGWSEDVRIEIRDGAFDGALLASVGPRSASINRVLIRDQGLYEACDEVARDLHGSDDLYAAILHALPDAERIALGFPHVGQGGQLKQALRALPTLPREQLVVPPVASGNPPMRLAAGRSGYVPDEEGMASVSAGPDREVIQLARAVYPSREWRTMGRLLGMENTGAVAAPRRNPELIKLAREVYPAHSWEAVERFLGQEQADDLVFSGRLGELWIEYQHLSQHLDSWIWTPSYYRQGRHFMAVSDTTRRLVAEEIKRCWRRETPAARGTQGALPGSRLRLDNHRVGTLPALTADFSHVSELSLNSVGVSGDIDGFLRRFSGVRWLTMSANELGALPPAIAAMGGLTKLILPDNGIVLTAQTAGQLARLTHLQLLTLEGNPLGHPLDLSALTGLRGLGLQRTGLTALPVGLERLASLEILDLSDNTLGIAPDVSSLTRLQSLHLRRTGISQWPTGFEHCPDLQSLDLSHNAISHIPASVETLLRALRPAQRWATNLLGNPLTGAARVTGLQLGLSGVVESVPLPDATDASLWLEGIAVEQQASRNALWQALNEEPGSGDFFKVIQSLTISADFTAAASRPALMSRVWRMMDAIAGNSELRGRVLRLSAETDTCADGMADIFSNLDFEVLLEQAQALADPVARGVELLKLAKSKARLQALGRVADGEYRRQLALEQPPDEVEIHLAYRIGLTQKLELLAQPEAMIFRAMSNVTPQQIEDAGRVVLAAEADGGLARALLALEPPFWREFLEQQHAAELKLNSEFYYARLEALEALKDKLDEWIEPGRGTEAERAGLREAITQLAADLDIAPDQLFSGQPMSERLYREVLEAIAEGQGAMLRRLTQEALDRLVVSGTTDF
ncbi:dermonecrotic toxin domain-containing protein [Pseudomonas gingeri]|uniref:dermonecrotic toxin domain-containing protein n=1 Tax=Pseudomonas gingeri TaxID=117681 RepID=UPI0015A4897D|nr:DUF6543 domain-containing protein [Pseudomonas gingeri]NWA03033.1 hypothetical protein [Pseudomonas gingeri]NWA17242.1 hypothetical protein [Pseudomonas gingeri]NWA57894.1 hypothetical protein [Pseudomonas gingeri]NWA98726.1 hypothetical protein [Pseudomonas gingeri]NWB02454.1 hypothetical protein [Pseudomonas gingeri]